MNIDREFRTQHLPFIKFTQAQRHRSFHNSNSCLSSSKTKVLRRWNYELNGVPDLNIIIPVYGRAAHLRQSLSCLVNQRSNIKIGTVTITVVEMSDHPEHESICNELKTQYFSIDAPSFNKSFAMNNGAAVFPASHFCFYDVDMIVEDGWLESCLETILQLREDSSCWISQPIPQRKIYYVNEENTSKIFSNDIKIEDIPDDDHLIQPEWYKNNFPPGGIVMLTAELLYAVQGYDDHIFWGYSPEDLTFLERCTKYSDRGDLIHWTAGPKSYHLYHPNSENSNMDYEFMVHTAEIIRQNEKLHAWYSQDKVRWQTFSLWVNNPQIWKGFEGKFPEHISDLTSTWLQEYSGEPENRCEYLLSRMKNKFPDLEEKNFSLFKIFQDYLIYIHMYHDNFFTLFRNG